MALVFSAKPGSVCRIDSQRPAVPFHINFGWTTVKCIVTQAAVEQQGNFQFLHTIDDMIYVYVFGDRIGELLISGVCFGDSCPNDGISGMDDALAYYKDNRIANRATPVKIMFGQQLFQGFLTANRVEVARPELILGQYLMRFNTFPSNS